MLDACLDDLVPDHLESDLAQLRERYLEKFGELRTNAQVEYKAKVRVSSLHDAAVTNVARSITTIILSRLGAIPEIKLRGTIGVELRTRHANALLCSADISDATGNLSHQTLNEIATTIGMIENLSTKQIQAWRLLVGPQRDTDGRITKKSAHMGIGAGWPILCLVLAFLAYSAGAEPEELAIMGDDSALLSSEKTRNEYMSLLDRFGLPVNQQKSFNGKTAGVFCEDALNISPDGLHTEFTLITPLGQASLKRIKEAAGGGDERPDKRGAAMSLQRHLRENDVEKQVRNLARRSCKRALWCKTEGPVLLGGNGHGAPTMNQMAGFIVHGPAKTSSRENQEYHLLYERFLQGHETRQSANTVELQEACTILMRESEIMGRFSGRLRKKKNFSSKQCHRSMKSLSQRGAALLQTHESLTGVLKVSNCYSVKAKRKITLSLQRSHGKVTKSICKQMFKLRSSRHTHIPEEVLREVEVETRKISTVYGHSVRHVHPPP
jgi:hypothetical protein